MKLRVVSSGMILEWEGGEVVLGVMPRLTYALLHLDRRRAWWVRGLVGRFFGFRIRRFVVSGWLA